MWIRKSFSSTMSLRLLTLVFQPSGEDHQHCTIDDDDIMGSVRVICFKCLLFIILCSTEKLFRALLLREKDPQRWKHAFKSSPRMNTRKRFLKVGDDLEPYEPQGGKEGDGLLEGEAPTYIQHHQVWWGRVSQASTCIQCDKICYPVRETMGLKQFSVEDIDTVLGILLVNDFEINSKVRKSFQKWHSAMSSNFQVEEELIEEHSVSGLYPLGCILSHHCLANTVHTFESIEVVKLAMIMMVITRKGSVWQCGRGGRSRKELRSRTAMSTPRWCQWRSKFWIILISHQDPFLVRQELLKMGKFFHCDCSRWPISIIF